MFNVEVSKLEKAHLSLKLPEELYHFYKNVGYGFLNRYDENPFDRLMSPLQVVSINLREDFYAHDPNLELYQDKDSQDKLIFFEINEGVYLLIDKEANDGKNAIYYFDEKIANSLEDFLIRFDREGHYFESE